VDKAKQEAKQSKEFAAMEEAAEKAYEEDLRRLEREAKGNFDFSLNNMKPCSTREELLLFHNF